MTDNTLLYVNILLFLIAWIAIWKPFIRSIYQSKFALLELKTIAYLKDNHIPLNSKLAKATIQRGEMMTNKFCKLEFIDLLIMHWAYRKYQLTDIKDETELLLTQNKKHRAFFDKNTEEITFMTTLCAYSTSPIGLIILIFTFLTAMTMVICNLLTHKSPQPLSNTMRKLLPNRTPLL